MGRISVKGVAVGALVDIFSSFAVGMILTIFILVPLLAAHLPPTEFGASIARTMQEPPLNLLSMSLGGLCSVLGGYVSARIAKHDELLHGALSAILCVSIGLYSLIAGTSHDSVLKQLALLAISPMLGALGGFLRLRQTA